MSAKIDPNLLLLDENVTADDASDPSLATPMDRYRHFTFQAFSDDDPASAAELTVEMSLDPDAPTHWTALGTLAVGEVAQLEGTFNWLRVVRDATTDPISCRLLRANQVGGN